MENGLEIDSAQTAYIQKQDYLRTQVSDHFAAPWKNRGLNLLSWNFYPVAAGLRGNKPHVRPIGGTQVECVHDLVIQKIDAPEARYFPRNYGLRSTDVCPGDDTAWERGS